MPLVRIAIAVCSLVCFRERALPQSATILNAPLTGNGPPSARKSVPVQTVIEHIVVDGVAYRNSDVLVIPPGRHKLQFRFFAAKPDNSDSVQFRYMLEGFDRDWTAAEGSRVATYANMPHGRYRFRVRCSRDVSTGASPGVADAGATASLEVQPWPWETPAFYLIAGMCIIGVVAAVSAHWTRKQRSKERKLLKLVDERTSALRESERQTRRSRDELEIRIHERTIEVVRSNHALEAEIQVRRAAERELTRAKVLAERASQVKTDLFASLSRQVRAPIGEIAAIADAALATELNDSRREHLLRVRTAAGTLTRVVEAMLAFAQMEREALDSGDESAVSAAEEHAEPVNFAILR